MQRPKDSKLGGLALVDSLLEPGWACLEDRLGCRCNDTSASMNLYHLHSTWRENREFLLVLFEHLSVVCSDSGDVVDVLQNDSRDVNDDYVVVDQCMHSISLLTFTLL